MRAAWANRLQTSLNLALGSALASIGLTIPTVALVSVWLDVPLMLGLDGKDIVMLALTFMDTEEKKTLPLVLQQFVGRGDTDWGAVMATSVIYTVPVILFFLLMRKRLMLGMTAGAVKG